MMVTKKIHVPATHVAAWFINHADRDAGEAITHLKVQKLVYYAEAWYLANFDTSLISEELQAWAHGPVALSVYKKYAGNGWDALQPESIVKVTAIINRFLMAVYAEYGQFSAKRLEVITHKEEPWLITRGDISPEAKCTKSIDKLLMRNYYGAKIGKKKISALPN
jgi:uncharacterized phage-associated protein